MVCMPAQKTFSVIVPLFNEAEGIAHLRQRLSPVLEKLSTRFQTELVLVDDGSKDSTKPLAEEEFAFFPNKKILVHEKNLGLGAALRTAFQNTSSELLFCLDSDCTYEPELVFALLEKMEETNADIVTASPYHPQGKVEGVPANRLFLSRGISWLYRLATGSKIHTFTAMVRLYKREAIEKDDFKSNDFLGVTELLVFPLLAGAKVEEVPAILKSRSFGRSSVRIAKVVRLIARHLIFVLVVILMRVAGKKGEKP